MEGQNINVEKLRYKCENIEFSLWIKMRGYIKGVLGRKNALKVFCQKNKIEYPVNTSILHSLPDKYLIEHDEIVYIAKIRDRIILGLHDGYSKKQQEIDSAIDEVSARIENDKDIQSDEEKRLERLKKQYASSKDSSESLWLESEIATTESGISNLKNTIAAESAEKVVYENVKNDNIDSWKKQLDIVSSAEDTQNGQFILALTKKITSKLGYKEYKYLEIAPSESVEKIKNGEYNVTNK